MGASDNGVGARTVGVEGQRFSLNYIARGEPGADSGRARLRAYRLFETLSVYPRTVSVQDIEGALGISVPYRGAGYDLKTFFSTIDLQDFLDLVTVVTRRIAANGMPTRRWLEGMRLIFREENLRYTVDERGGVHFAIDGEFERNQASAIAALAAERYRAALTHLEAAHSNLDAVPPNGREAIRRTFDCVETIFKLMFPGESRLDAVAVTKKLRPCLGRQTDSDHEAHAAGQLAEALSKWITSAHQFRHAQADEHPTQPTLATTVLSVSMGASFARWLAELDQAMSG